MKLDQIEKSVHFRQISQPPQQVNHVESATKPEHSDFGRLLEQQIARSGREVKFSAHATERLASRNIVLTERDLTRIDRAISNMAEKGGKESLLVMGDLSFVVSVENKTVITAMQNHTGGENKIFTNIDSALIL